MPAKKGNTHGKQFSKDYQPAEIWTEENALRLGNDLIAWLLEKETNIFFLEFLVIDNDYSETLTAYLSSKFKSFSRLLFRAKKIQEAKLLKYGVLDKLNSSMTKFVLINNHGYTDRKAIENTIIQTDAEKLALVQKINFIESGQKVEEEIESYIEEDTND